MTTVNVVTPGKLILMGEYAVLEGASALVAAVGAKSKVSLALCGDSTSFLHAPEINFENVSFDWCNGKLRWSPALKPVEISKVRLVETVLAYFSEQFKERYGPRGIRLEIETADFYSEEAGCKLGLGSSASVCVGLTTAFLSLLEHQEGLELDKIFATAFRLHREAQGGVGSGVDVAASVYGGYLNFTTTGNGDVLPEVVTLDGLSDLHILPIFTGRSAGTVDLVNQVFSLRSSSPQIYGELLDGLCRLAEQGLDFFSSGDTSGFTQTIVKYGDGLRRLGEAAQAPIVSGLHARVHQVVAGLGGVYKVSGAGGGDFGLSFWGNSENARIGKKHLIANGWTVPDLELGAKGVSYAHDG